MIRIIFGGDVCPMGKIQKTFIEGNAEQIFHDLLEDIISADLSVVNLECPLISKETPIAKGGGPVLGANINCINGFAAAKWSVLNLANNHSFDHGEIGLKETIDTIRDAGLNIVGAGLDINTAQKPLVKIIKDQRIVVYSMAEHEYSVADVESAGANPLDLINFIKAISQYKQDDIFIVLIHGGAELYPYPSPRMVRACRFMVDMGADAVICCHAHCPIPWEIYGDRPIIYGLGNLIFEGDGKEPDMWYEGYLARLTIEDKQIHFDAIPYIQSLNRSGAQKMKGNVRKQFFNAMETKSAQLKDNVFLDNQWVQYCRQQKSTYLSWLFGYNRQMQKYRRLLFSLLHSKEEICRALLLVQCEAHQEILNTIFKEERQAGKHAENWHQANFLVKE